MARIIHIMKPYLILSLLSILPIQSLLADTYETPFTDGVERYFVAPEIWTNPMEGWKLKNGQLVVNLPKQGMTAHCLTHQLAPGDGKFSLQVDIKALKGNVFSTGFSFGVRSKLGDYRSALIHGKGIPAGIDASGNLFIGEKTASEGNLPLSLKSCQLILTGTQKDDSTDLTLTAYGENHQKLGSVSTTMGPLSGNLALAAYFKNARVQQVAFDNWKITGSKVKARKNQSFGPILWSQYTLSRKVMKMTALLAPIATTDPQTCELQVTNAGKWSTLATSKIHPQSFTAEFRVENWDDTQNHEYRVVYQLKNDSGKMIAHQWSGTVRRNPIDKNLTIAAFTGNKSEAFPNALIAKNVTYQNPDLLFFSGDQIYENVGGFGFIRTGPNSIPNYLRKYYLFGWAFRDLMKNRPTIILPDDHDVFQGNVWGNGGNAITLKDHANGGYVQSPDFVNAVHRTQVSQHPDAYDPTPIKQGITAYYGDMLYGRVSFAILADRMFKSGPKGLVNTGRGRRPDWLMDKSINSKSLDNPKAKLLGDRQLQFLDHWVADWKGADEKIALSATILCNLANYHGPKQTYLVADLDSNGWPQTGRNKALDIIRRGHALMIAGDQHLASVVHHGIDSQKDAGISFCVPSIVAGYPRSWRPDKEHRPVKNRVNGLANTGEYEDGFGNLVHVIAVANPEKKNRPPVLERLHDKASGYGMVTVNRQAGTMTLDCYKLLIDTQHLKPNDQFPGWPVTLKMTDNYGREAVAMLPNITVTGLKHHPVIKVYDAKNNLVYALRSPQNTYTPKVFAQGTYTVKIGDPDTDQWKSLKLDTEKTAPVKITF